MAFTPRSDEKVANAITRLVDGMLNDAERLLAASAGPKSAA